MQSPTLTSFSQEHHKVNWLYPGFQGSHATAWLSWDPHSLETAQKELHSHLCHNCNFCDSQHHLNAPLPAIVHVLDNEDHSQGSNWWFTMTKRVLRSLRPISYKVMKPTLPNALLHLPVPTYRLLYGTTWLHQHKVVHCIQLKTT